MAPSDLVTRQLTTDDSDQIRALGQEAFGAPPAGSATPTPTPAPEPSIPPGEHPWGVFDDDRLVVHTVGHEYHSWFGGAAVATCGIAGVTVVAERRGDGLLAGAMRSLLEEARVRGEVLSTLYPTAPGIYRRLGYELISGKDVVEIPTAEVAGARPPVGVTTRRATVADVATVRRLYDTWAAAQNGPLTRSGVSFTASDQEFLDSFTGITLAVDATGEIVGFASWHRGTGYDPAIAVIEVEDFIALSADGARALWRVIGSFSVVAGRLRLSTSGADTARLVLPTSTWRVVFTRPYMLRVLDVPGAFAARPFEGAADLTFAVAGDPFGFIDGSYRLRVADGQTTCERVDDPDGPDTLRFTPQGLALAYAGVQSCANLRMAGHLAGPTTYDATLDRMLGGRNVHIRDYF